MANYWAGPSWLQKQSSLDAKNPFIDVRPPRRYRFRVRPLLPRRLRLLIQRLRSNLREIRFLARYVAHLAIFFLVIIATMLPSYEWLSLLIPQFSPDRPEAMNWAAAQDDNMVYLTWNASPLTVFREHAAVARLEPIVYRVQKKDTLQLIAQRFGLQAESLLWANREIEQNHGLLSLDQRLIIPPVDGILHLVEPNESLGAIAQSYQVPLQAITDYPSNQTSGGKELLEGQLLVVPGGKAPPTPTATPTPTPTPTATPTPMPTSTPIPTAMPTFVPTRVPIIIVPTIVPTYPPLPTRTPLPTYTPVPRIANNSQSSSYIGSTGCCRWPVTGLITSQPTNWHMAIDIATSLGTPVVAADGGRVVSVGWDKTGYGYHVIIDHGSGIRTLYAHLSRYTVDYGDYVNKGQLIGRIGSTGLSTGPHLHFEVRLFNVRQNPWSWLP